MRSRFYSNQDEQDNSLKPEKLYVVTMISNPVRFKSRYALYEQFQKHMSCSGAELLTVELAFGTRPFEITNSANPMHLQLRTVDELWHKENAINLGIQYLTQRIDPDWKYVAWIDADVMFSNPKWVEETIAALQHYEVVQMWSKAIDLDPQMNPLKTHQSFMRSYLDNDCRPHDDLSYTHGGAWHPGYAWAATRRFIDRAGGLIDFAILGSADRHMALALTGAPGIPAFLSAGYKESLLIWSDRVAEHIKEDVGCMDGTILHYWHGKKANRQYSSRWKILENNEYDPEYDLKKDAQGLWQLVTITPRQKRLRDEIRAYFRTRNEDSIDV